MLESSVTLEYMPQSCKLLEQIRKFDSHIDNSHVEVTYLFKIHADRYDRICIRNSKTLNIFNNKKIICIKQIR